MPSYLVLQKSFSSLLIIFFYISLTFFISVLMRAPTRSAIDLAGAGVGRDDYVYLSYLLACRRRHIRVNEHQHPDQNQICFPSLFQNRRVCLRSAGTLVGPLCTAPVSPFILDNISLLQPAAQLSALEANSKVLWRRGRHSRKRTRYSTPRSERNRLLRRSARHHVVPLLIFSSSLVSTTKPPASCDTRRTSVKQENCHEAVRHSPG
jgi:hypothetical protein